MRLYYRFCRCLCQWFCILFFRVRCHGLRNLPPRGAVLIVSNHQSFVDPLLTTIAVQREGNYMARDTLFTNRWFGRLISSVNAFPVKRGAADIGAIKESLRRLRAGGVLLLFPEGTRSEDGKIGRMLPGVGSIALRARVPIVPTLVDGVHELWPKGVKFPRPGEVMVEYGTPLQPEEYASWTAEQLMDELRRRILVMQQRWRGRMLERRLQWFRPAGEPRHDVMEANRAPIRGADVNAAPVAGTPS